MLSPAHLLGLFGPVLLVVVAVPCEGVPRMVTPLPPGGVDGLLDGFALIFQLFSFSAPLNGFGSAFSSKERQVEASCLV